jgi:hypothetical protein
MVKFSSLTPNVLLFSGQFHGNITIAVKWVQSMEIIPFGNTYSLRRGCQKQQNRSKSPDFLIFWVFSKLLNFDYSRVLENIKSQRLDLSAFGHAIRPVTTLYKYVVNLSVKIAVLCTVQVVLPPPVHYRGEESPGNTEHHTS